MCQVNTTETIEWIIDGESEGNSECITVNTSGLVEVNVSNNAGCTALESFDISAIANPVVTVDTPDLLDCNNAATTLNLTVDNPAHVINWYNSQSELISNDEDVTVDQAGVYTVVVVNDTGCETSMDIAVEANLDDLPQANFIYQNTEFDFQFEDSSEGVINDRLWDFGDGNNSADENPSHSYSDPGYYNVCLSTTNDCGTSIECQEVLARAAMQISSVINNVSCNGLNNGSIITEVFGGLPGFEFEWEGENGNYTGNPVENLPPGNYILNVSDATGAVLTDNYEILEPEVITTQAIISNVTGAGSNGSIILNIFGGNGEYTVAWNNGSTELILENLDPGDYTVVITDAKGCQKTDTFTVQNSTNVDEIEFVKSFNVYPNPAADNVTIDLDLEHKADIQLSLISVLGQVEFSQTLNTSSLKKTLDLTNLTNGLYLVEIKTGGKIALKKLFIAR